MKSEILPNLYVGDLPDAIGEAAVAPMTLIVCVLEYAPPVPNVTWIPILQDGRASVPQLAKVAELIETALAAERRVLVHCGAGVERSPLAVAWFLHTRRGMTLDAAYQLLKTRRPVVEDRRVWLPVGDAGDVGPGGG